MDVRIGTAGWGIPARLGAEFPGAASHLERYAGQCTAVEINSSFHRPHRPATYERWARSVPEDFRFAVKLPREITHSRRLLDAESALDRFLAEAGVLGGRLGPLLVQLPPSLAFDAGAASAFFGSLRARFAGAAVCEPRHPSWFGTDGDALLASFAVARVAADPARVPAAADPGGWPGLAYYRLHGSPQTYYSAYEPATLEAVAQRLMAAARRGPAWCIFDNTGRGEAAANALDLRRLCQQLAAEEGGAGEGEAPGRLHPPADADPTPGEDLGRG